MANPPGVSRYGQLPAADVVTAATHDLALARQQWERSTELRQKVGHLLGALAQQTLLAVLLRDEGDIAGSQELAAEVNRWATQVDLKFIVQETAGLMADRTQQARPR
ncbi:hypothetical protein ACIA58_21120 [Kribbella sp. NPDC051586]|uniref:hypothetical protein n=1 Tax=Kribbella sp. NPDC051586 TaxID=3364118 RepID=UPI00378A63E1